MRTQVTSLFGCFAIVGALSPMAFCGERPEAVRFCDYASGAGLWRSDNVCRTWFDVQGDVVEALK